MRLAYACLREGRYVLWDALEALHLGDERAVEIAYCVERSDVDPRLLRARLALLLRAMLRAASGDLGRQTFGWFCASCGTRSTLPDHCPWEGQGPGSCKCDKGCACQAPERWVQHRKMTPLWQIAPATGAGRGR